MNLVENFEKSQIDKLTSGKNIPSFKAGDTVKVTIRIFDKDVERKQAFEGVVLAIRNRSINTSFLVREMKGGDHRVEKRFMLYSPIINKIEVLKLGSVRRAKIYYIRSLSGKAARISEKKVYNTIK